MCFAPQWRSLFQHLNFQKWSEAEVCFVHFDFDMCLPPQTACNFSSDSSDSAPAALASLLFDPPEPQTMGKNTVNRLSYLFRAPASSFFPLFLFSDLLPSFLLLADSSHLCFSICPHIVGSLTSKFPSVMYSTLSLPIFFLQRFSHNHQTWHLCGSARTSGQRYEVRFERTIVR